VPRLINIMIPLLLSLACFLVSGCAVGPDFHRPDAPVTSRYGGTPLPAETDSSPADTGGAQRFVEGMDIPEQWWFVFQSEPLDRVIREALKQSPTLRASQAAMREAVENRNAQLGALFPAVDADFSADRSRITGASFGQPGASGGIFTLYNASVNVSYNLDLFGATRRGLEVLKAQVDYQRYLLEGSFLTISSNIVDNVVKEASLRARISATSEIIAAEREQLALVERKFQLGAASQPDVLARQAQIAATQATLPVLEKELSLGRHQLAILTGKLPSDESSLPRFELANLKLPLQLPVSLPSSLVRQRPDIRASEEVFHSACAQVGVATANLFPRLTISGNYGTQSTILTGLFSPGTAVWSIGAGLLQPLFRGGELTAKRRAAIAALDRAEADYRQTILLSFQNVADVLRTIELDAVALKSQAEAEAVARNSLELTKKQYLFGAVNYSVLLDSQSRYQQARINLIQAQASRLADSAALFHALGGGWWNRLQDGTGPTISKNISGDVIQ
jgi:NodT family efflux transporter outer membrane factor (OMF) lipoprotein